MRSSSARTLKAAVSTGPLACQALFAQAFQCAPNGFFFQWYNGVAIRFLVARRRYAVERQG